MIRISCYGEFFFENDSRESFGDSERERKVMLIKKFYYDIDFMV